MLPKELGLSTDTPNHTTQILQPYLLAARRQNVLFNDKKKWIYYSFEVTNMSSEQHECLMLQICLYQKCHYVIKQ